MSSRLHRKVDFNWMMSGVKSILSNLEEKASGDLTADIPQHAAFDPRQG